MSTETGPTYLQDAKDISPSRTLTIHADSEVTVGRRAAPSAQSTCDTEDPSEPYWSTSISQALSAPPGPVTPSRCPPPAEHRQTIAPSFRAAKYAARAPAADAASFAAGGSASSPSNRCASAASPSVTKRSTGTLPRTSLSSSRSRPSPS